MIKYYLIISLVVVIIAAIRNWSYEADLNGGRLWALTTFIGLLFTWPIFLTIEIIEKLREKYHD